MGLSRSVSGKKVVITGAASGMGAATAMVFAQDGAEVAVTDVDFDGAEAVAHEIRLAGGKAKAWQLDVANGDAIRRVINDIALTLSGLDIIINNAGVAWLGPVDSDDFEDNWARLLNILLTAQQRVIRASLPHLRQSSSPRIVNIASTEALGATKNNSAYAAAKAGVTGLTRALAVELGRDGITVNCVCPGPIETRMTAKIPDEQKTVYAHRHTALRRYGSPEEVAHITLSMCLPAASYLTGVVVPVDGGLLARSA